MWVSTTVRISWSSYAMLDEAACEGFEAAFALQAGVDQHPAVLLADEVDVDVRQLKGNGQRDPHDAGGDLQGCRGSHLAASAA